MQRCAAVDDDENEITASEVKLFIRIHDFDGFHIGISVIMSDDSVYDKAFSYSIYSKDDATNSIKNGTTKSNNTINLSTSYTGKTIYANVTINGTTITSNDLELLGLE